MGKFDPRAQAHLTLDELRHTLSADVASLAADLRAVYEAYAVPPIRLSHVVTFEGAQYRLPVWIIARKGTTVLGYDEVEEEYGTGIVRSANLGGSDLVDSWGTYDQLASAIPPFLNRLPKDS